MAVTECVCLSHAQETVLESKDAKTTGPRNEDEEEVDLQGATESLAESPGITLGWK